MLLISEFGFGQTEVFQEWLYSWVDVDGPNDRQALDRPLLYLKTVLFR